MSSKYVRPKVMLILSIIFLSQVYSSSQCVPRVNPLHGDIFPNSGCGMYTSASPYSPGTHFRTSVLSGASYTISTCGASIDTEITGFQGGTTDTSIFYNNDNGPECVGLAASITYVPNFNDYMRVAVQEFSCLPGGSQSITVYMRQNNNLSITSSSDSMCEGQTRTLTATPTPVGSSQPNAGNLGTFSGTGVSGTTFTAPAVGGTSLTITITYTYAYCSTTQDITVFNTPLTADAGPDQVVCDTTATLAGITPAGGSGIWSLLTGSGVITSPSSPTSGITGLGVGANSFQWKITDDTCFSSDTVVITRDDNPTTADVGPDQDICVDTAEVAAAVPVIGSGMWSLIGGSGTIVNPSSTFTSITGVGFGPNTFRWTVTNGVCTPSTDDVVITRDPTQADAGPDQVLPIPVATLGGNSPGTGTGVWTVVSGAGTFLNDTVENSVVTGMNYGINRFSWTVTGTCVPGGDTDTVDIVYDCEAVLTLQGIYPSGTYQADSSLTMRGLVPSPNIVTARAGFEVTLLDTFEVGLGAEFDAIINLCGSFLIENDNARSGNTNKDKEDTPATNKSILQLDVKLE